VEEKKVDDHLFDLPALPRKIFTASQLYSPAHYPGNNGAWLKYLQTNLDGNLALKYVKISKDQAEASQQVIVEFVVSEDGSVNNLHVINKQEVNSHLAEEAMRVIRDSPRWAPAMFFGEKITTSVKQPVIFAVKR
jgi:TonB family protein